MVAAHRQALSSLATDFTSNMKGGAKVGLPIGAVQVSWIQQMVGSKVGTELAYRWHQINSFKTVATLRDGDVPHESTGEQ